MTALSIWMVAGAMAAILYVPVLIYLINRHLDKKYRVDVEIDLDNK